MSFYIEDMHGLIICEFVVYGESLHQQNGNRHFYVRIVAVFQTYSSFSCLIFSNPFLVDGIASLAVDNKPDIATCSVTNGKMTMKAVTGWVRLIRTRLVRRKTLPTKDFELTGLEL